MEFRDFNIEILAKRDGRFDVRVASRASGELQASVTLDHSVDDLLAALDTRGEATRSAEAARAFTPDSQHVPEAPRPEVGQVLFDMLFSAPEVSRALAECMTDAKSAQAGVRLKLTMNTRDDAVADLARLPWELLHDESKYKYFALRPDSPIVRYLEVPKPFAVGAFTPPLRILAVSANPRRDLALDRERDNLRAALGGDDDVELTFVEQATIQAVAAELTRARTEGRDFHVVHYMGHGDFHDGRGVLLLHKESGGEDLVEAEAFATALQAAGEVRLVFLNACNTAQSREQGGSDPFSGVATSLVFEGIPAVVAMQRPVPDAAAIVLAKHFYSNVAKGWPVDAALSEGRRQMFFADRDALDWAIPVLFMRSPDGVLFDIADRPARATVAGGTRAAPPAVDAPSAAPSTTPVPFVAASAPTRSSSWITLAAAGVVGATLVAGAVYLLSGASEPREVQFAALGQSAIAMGETIEAHVRLLDENNVTIQGEALADYAVDWTASADGIVTITPKPVTPDSQSLDAVIAGVRPPPNRAPVTITATLRDFPELKDSRPVDVTLSESEKDGFRDAYRAALKKFGEPTVDDATVVNEFKALRASSGWILGYVDEMDALNDTEKAGAKALAATVTQIESVIAAFEKARSEDAGATLPEREKAWAEYLSTVEDFRPASPTAGTARENLGAIDTIRKTSATVLELRTCGAGAFSGTGCRRVETDFAAGDAVWYHVAWSTPPSMPGRDGLVLEWGSVGANGAFTPTASDATTREPRRPEPRNNWNPFTASGRGPYELRVKNTKGVLVWRQSVTVK